MEGLGTVLVSTAVAVAFLMLATWLLSLPIRNASIVDIVWGPGFVIVAWTAFLVSDGADPRRWLLATLTTLWGLRLSLYLAIRNLGKKEDYRYRGDAAPQWRPLRHDQSRGPFSGCRACSCGWSRSRYRWARSRRHRRR